MNNCALVSSRFQVPLNKVVQHAFKVINRFLRVGNTVIGPTHEMNLSHILFASVWPERLQLSSHEVLRLLHLLQQLDLHIVIFLSDAHIVASRMSRIIRPKLVAFLAAQFDSLAGAHHHGHILLEDHLPEVLSRLW